MDAEGSIFHGPLTVKVDVVRRKRGWRKSRVANHLGVAPLLSKVAVDLLHVFLMPSDVRRVRGEKVVPRGFFQEGLVLLLDEEPVGRIIFKVFTPSRRTRASYVGSKSFGEDVLGNESTIRFSPTFKSWWERRRSVGWSSLGKGGERVGANAMIGEEKVYTLKKGDQRLAFDDEILVVGIRRRAMSTRSKA